MRNRFVQYCRANLDFNVRDYYYHKSIILCAMEAAFSATTRFTAVTNVITHFCDWARANGIDLDGVTIPECYEEERQIPTSVIIPLLNGYTPQAFADLVENHSRVAGRLKAELFFDIVHIFQEFNIETYQDFQAQFGNNDLLDELKNLRGMGAATINYIYMLAGSANQVKIDRWIRRFTQDATHVNNLTDAQIQELFIFAANELSNEHPGLTARHLDHIVWHNQRHHN